MAGVLGQVGGNFGAVFRSFTPGQKIALVLVVVMMVAGITGIVKWASAPEYVQLYSGLPPDEAGKIVEWLVSNNVAYKLEDGGSRILVPRDDVYNARIRLAQEGMPATKNTGYELFDETNLGMSEFVQKLNYRRALEGELARTIEELDEVSSTRVHIVLPEPALFRDKEQPATASIAVKLKNRLTPQQISGITHLVASAVEGLDADNITIIDSHGTLLSSTNARDPLMAQSSTQLQMKETVEDGLTRKVSTMLEKLLGPNKAIVRVSADLDFSRSEVTSELYDPEKTAVRSEESIETTKNNQEQNQVNPADPSKPPLGTISTTSETNAITNYEISKTLSHVVSNTGGIKKLSASVLVDGTYKTITNEDGTTTEEYIPRSSQEMEQITLAVRNALGINDTRGDQLSVQNIAFQAPKYEIPQEGGGIVDWFKENWYPIIQQVFLGLAIIGVLIYVQNLVRKTTRTSEAVHQQRLAALPAPAAPAYAGELPGSTMERIEPPPALPTLESELSPEVLAANQLQDRLQEFVEEKPESAAQLLKTWLVGG